MGFSSLVGAGVSGITSLLGAKSVSSAASQAAAYQAAAGQQAEGALNNALGASTQQLTPYTALGQSAAATLGDTIDGLSTAAASPTARYVDPANYATSGTANNISGTADNVSATPYQTTTNLDEGQLQQTPGYQFTLNQGEKAVQNSAAARGLGVSGAALKGAATYATGLADSTYQQQYQDELTSNAQNFSNANAAATTKFGQQATAAQTNYSQQAGANAQNYSNALTGAAQHFNVDQTGFQDAQSGKAQSAGILSNATQIGEGATNALVNANTQTAQGTANALTGVGSAQAAAANASGQAYGSAYQGVGNALTGAIGNYNGYGIATALNPSLGNANTVGSGLNALLGSGSNGSNFLNTVAGAINKTGSGAGTNV